MSLIGVLSLILDKFDGIDIEFLKIKRQSLLQCLKCRINITTQN